MEYLGAADFAKFNRMAVKSAQEVMGYVCLDQFLTAAHTAATSNNIINSFTHHDAIDQR